MLTAVTACAAGFLGGFAIARYSRTETNKTSSKVIQAAAFSGRKHRDQRRKNVTQEPYINHPLRVAALLSSIGAEECVLISALLHDCVEDCDCSLAEIEEFFGSKVASIVAEVTDDKSLPKDVRKQQQIDHAPFISKEAKLVKLADKLDNLSDLIERAPVGWTPSRVDKYFLWAEKVVLGLRGTNAELEQKLDEVFQRRPDAVAAAATASPAT